jgi:hypothetical protein
MTSLVLEPYAIQQRWSAGRPLEPGEWTALFGDYLAGLASACAGSKTAAATQKAVIGHIKLLALFDGREYLRVSVVSPARAPTVTGAVPANLAEVTVTVNVLVYGLPFDTLAALTAVAAHEVAKHWGTVVTEEARAGNPPHQPDEHDVEESKHAH